MIAASASSVTSANNENKLFNCCFIWPTASASSLTSANNENKAKLFNNNLASYFSIVVTRYKRAIAKGSIPSLIIYLVKLITTEIED